MKNIKNYIIESSVAEDDEKLVKALKEFADEYKYDAVKLVAMVNIFMRDMFMNEDTKKLFKDSDKAVTKFKKEFEVFQGEI